MIKTIVITIVLGLVSNVFASTNQLKEKDYQKQWCDENRGRMEVIVKNGTRVDCLTQQYAVEFDYAKKWAEAIGQSLNYGALTQKEPGIVLIVNNREDERHLDKLLNTIRYYSLPIHVWTISDNMIMKNSSYGGDDNNSYETGKYGNDYSDDVRYDDYRGDYRFDRRGDYRDDRIQYNNDRQYTQSMSDTGQNPVEIIERIISEMFSGFTN